MSRAGTLALLLASAALAQGGAAATVETAPVPTPGDSAFDTAIWIHPTDVSRSLVLGTDQLTGGVFAYGLDGAQVDFVLGPARGIDVRHGFPLGGGRVALVAAASVNTGAISLFTVDPSTRRLAEVSSRALVTGAVVSSLALYRSPSGRSYAFVGDQAGGIQQWELFDDGAGKVDGARRRELSVGAPVGGLAADDRHGALFVSERASGLWRYSAEPDGGAGRVQVAAVGSAGLVAPVEGLALYETTDGGGYLLASSQGANAFSVFQRASPHEHVTSFELVADGGIDGVSGTRGIAVSSFGLGPAFPDGLFVAHDAVDELAPDFKLVPWRSIAAASSPPLVVDPSNDPRAGIGDGGSTRPDGGGGGGGIAPGGGVSYPPEPRQGCGCAGGGSVLAAALAALSALAARRRG